MAIRFLRLLLRKSQESVESTADESSCSSLATTPCLMEQRLLQTGLVSINDFDFVPDTVSKEIEGSSMVPDTAQHAHVKTGVWQVRLGDDDTQYIATAVSMTNRIDTKKLRRALREIVEVPPNTRPRLILAPTEIAQELTGYVSGTMSPICHSTPLHLIVEESLLESTEWSAGSGVSGQCLCMRHEHCLAIAKLTGLTICPIKQKHKA